MLRYPDDRSDAPSLWGAIHPGTEHSEKSASHPFPIPLARHCPRSFRASLAHGINGTIPLADVRVAAPFSRNWLSPYSYIGRNRIFRKGTIYIDGKAFPEKDRSPHPWRAVPSGLEPCGRHKKTSHSTNPEFLRYRDRSRSSRVLLFHTGNRDLVLRHGIAECDRLENGFQEGTSGRVYFSLHRASETGKGTPGSVGRLPGMPYPSSRAEDLLAFDGGRR